MAQVVEMLTIGVCGLGAVVVTVMALTTPLRPKSRKPRQQLQFNFEEPSTAEREEQHKRELVKTH